MAQKRKVTSGPGITDFSKLGTVRTPQERAEVAQRRGMCVACGIPTHHIHLLGKKALTNRNVHRGICIRCHHEEVPVKVYHEWKQRYKELSLSPPTKFSQSSDIDKCKSNDLRNSTAQSVPETDLQPKAITPSAGSIVPTTPHQFATTQSQTPQNLQPTGSCCKKGSTATAATTATPITDKTHSYTLRIFQACPLAYEDFLGNLHPMKNIDLDTEVNILQEAVKGTNVKVHFETATANSLGAFLCQGNPMLHFSCHGHKEYLFIEDGITGGAQLLLVDENLKGWIRAGGQQLSFVFVSACHSRSAGDAFVDAGVPHVLCCEHDNQLLSNTAAMIFSRDFYRAVAHGKTIQQAFDLAKYAVMYSSELLHKNHVRPEQEAEKFVLLPEKSNHNVLLFPAPTISELVPEIPTLTQETKPPSMLPVPPQHFLGRELEMYWILKSMFLKGIRLVRITGPGGVGKTSIAKALGHYMEKRSMWGEVYWLPSTYKGQGIYSQWYNLVCLLENESADGASLESSDTYQRIRSYILSFFYDKKAVLIFNVSTFTDNALSKLSIFLDDVFEGTKQIKVIIVHLPLSAPIQSKRIAGALNGYPCAETSYTITPLNYIDTRMLFEYFCPHTPCSRQSHGRKEQNDSESLYKLLGNGIPAQILLVAKNMTKNEYTQVFESEEEVDYFNESLKLTQLAYNAETEGNNRRFNSCRGAEELHENVLDDNNLTDTPVVETTTTPPLRSQIEVYNRFAPLLRKEGSIFRKKVTSFIRRAVKGERVVTTIDGVQETQYEVDNDTSWVVCGRAAGEYYVLSQDQLEASYDTDNPREISPISSPRFQRLRQQGFAEYRSNRQVWARKVDENDMLFFRHGKVAAISGSNHAFFIAPWGESMLVEVGDFLVMQYPRGSDEIYRIECRVFGDSYASTEQAESTSNKSSSLSVQDPTILLVFAVGILSVIVAILLLQGRNY